MVPLSIKFQWLKVVYMYVMALYLEKLKHMLLSAALSSYIRTYYIAMFSNKGLGLFSTHTQTSLAYKQDWCSFGGGFYL